EYQRLNRQRNVAITEDREKFWQAEVKHLESAVNNNNMSRVFSLLRQAHNGPRIKTALVKDSDGNLIATEANCLECWKEHFSLLLQHVSFGSYHLTDLEYADDTILLSTSYSELRDTLGIYSEEAEKLGLQLSWTKTKFMYVGDRPHPPSLRLGNDIVEPVKNYVYLGSIVTDNGDLKPGITRRRALATSALQSLWKPLWRHQTRGGVDLIAMDDVTIFNNYVHSDWFYSLCQRFIHVNIVEHNIILPYSNKGFK
uniref:Reverse transcriptase domain-containing protein n=1 Tax=Cyprinus carpio TaxID=7962 RepID=A0A8C2BVL8_CYPCA